MTIDSTMRRVLVTGAALFAAIAISGGAGATANTAASSALTGKVAACGKLPLSEREMCIAQAQANSSRQAAQPAMSEAQRAALSRTEGQYRAALAKCVSLPVSEREICQARAQAERSRSLAAANATPETRAMLDREMNQYQAALAGCSRLPLSEREMCIANAGTSHSLPAKG